MYTRRRQQKSSVSQASSCGKATCKQIKNPHGTSSVQFSRFLFPPLVEQNTYINAITPRKKGHATKRNNVVTCKNSINYTSKGNGLHGCTT